MAGAELVDRARVSRALVYGSLPPGGRDLDLLVAPDDERELASVLTDAGYLCRDATWVRFAAGGVDIGDLTQAGDWDLPDDELRALFADAISLQGFARLARPAPHHELLVVARRVAGEGGRYRPKLRARVDAAIAEDPGAWDRAAEHAGAWGAGEALERLRTLHEAGAHDEDEPPRQRRRLHNGAVIAFSGLDGAGKSTQVRALHDALERLDYDVTTVWTRVGWDDALWAVAEPVKAVLLAPVRLLGWLRRGAGSGAAATDDGRDDGAAGAPGAAGDPIRRLRERSSLALHAWVAVVALANAISQRRNTRAVVRRGGIVICDRYTLDSVVALRCTYAPQRRLRLQRRLIEILSPRPRRAYYLDVSPETAFARKGEGGIEWLADHRELYRQEHVDLGVRLLDGERPAGELCAEIASDVWQSGL